MKTQKELELIQALKDLKFHLKGVETHFKGLRTSLRAVTSRTTLKIKKDK